MNKMKIFYTITILILLVIYSSCDIKYNLTDYIQDIDNSSWTNLGDELGTANTMGISSLFVVNEIPYLAYINNTNDLSSDDDVVIVKRYNNDIWYTLNGFPNIPIFTGSATPISITYMNNLFVSYIDTVYNAHFMEYNFNTWTEYDVIPSCINAVITSMNNKIYGAYQDSSLDIGAYANGNTTIFSSGFLPSATTFTIPVTAFKNGATIDIRGYDESTDTWNIPINDITGTAPTQITIRGSGSNLVICYEDSGYIYVKRFNNLLNTWEDVGGPGHTFENAQMYYDKSLAVYGNYVYLAYSETLKSNKATVVRCNKNGSWEVLGEKGFTSHGALNISIQVSNGIPYISYHKNSTSGKIVVMKYD